eukprot:SAG11_NODE_26053_length_350_cov_1.075697_1_plen_116_part_11
MLQNQDENRNVCSTLVWDTRLVRTCRLRHSPPTSPTRSPTYEYLLCTYFRASACLTWLGGQAQVNASNVLELDPLDGRLKPLLDDSPWLPGLQLAIDAGGARVLALQMLAREDEET